MNPKIQELLSPNKPDFELVIMYPTYKFDVLNKNSAIMTMYEAARCPDEWVKKLNILKIPIFAPSKFVETMFKDSGVKNRIEVLNLGVDSTFYFKKKRVFPEDRAFRFLTIGKLEPRKNVSVLVKCFQDTFKDTNVELIIKTRERFLPGSIRAAATRDSRIKIIEKTITEEELRNIYYYADAFIYPSRGEGFAFPPRCAVSTALPTVVTGWSALDEISGASRVPVARFSPMPACGFSYGQEKELLMADIDEEELSKEMLLLATSKKYFDKQANIVYNTKQDTWEDCARNFIEMVSK